MSLMKHKRAMACGVALLCAVASLAVPAAELQVQSIRIRYVASQLSTPEGTKKLYSQIQRAAQIVCHKPDMHDLAPHPDYRTCYGNAVNNAVASVNESTLTALHRHRLQRGAAG